MATDKTTTIRLSPERRDAIDNTRHATVSRQAWVDAAIDRALTEEAKRHPAR